MSLSLVDLPPRAAERRLRFISDFLNAFCSCPYLPAGLFARPSARQPVWILHLLFDSDLIYSEPQEQVQLLDLLSCRAESCLLPSGAQPPPSPSNNPSMLTPAPPPSTMCTYWIPLFTMHSDKGICQADEQSEMKRCVMHAWKVLTSCRDHEDAEWRSRASPGGGRGPQAGL